MLFLMCVPPRQVHQGLNRSTLLIADLHCHIIISFVTHFDVKRLFFHW